MINGGYILQPRCIGESRIAHCPPHFREIWFWILREANHKNTKVCDRGECIRSYRDMQEGLHWFVGWRKETYKKHHCEKAMKWLVKEHMIEARKTTRGMHIKVLNYDYYQNPVNYESDKESDKKATRKRQSSDTINKNVKNVKNVENVKKVVHPSKEVVKKTYLEQLRDEKFIELLKKEFPEVDLKTELRAMVDWIKANGNETKYKDYQAFARNWLRRTAKELKAKDERRSV